MALGLHRWRLGSLLLAWGGYWATLAAVTLGDAIHTIWLVTRPNEHGNVAANAGDGIVGLTVTRGGVTEWSGSTSLSALVFWIAGPPLLLWLLWLVSRPRRGVVDARGLDSMEDPRVLNAPSAEPFAPTRQRQPSHERRDGAL